MDADIAALDHEQPDFQTRYGRLLSRIHQTIDQHELKTELIIMARTLDRAEAAMSINASRIGVEGKIAYCVNRGARLPHSSIQRVLRLLDHQNVGGDETPSWESLPENAQSRTIRAYVACYSRIDNAKTRVLLGKLSQRELAQEVRKIVSTFGMGKESVVKQLADHYKASYLEARDDNTIASWVKPLGTIAEAIGLMLSNRVSVKAGARTAKARRLKSTVDTLDRKGEAAAAKVTYKDEDIDLGIRSVDPVHVVGASVAVVYNTKNRHCEVYMAAVGSSLSVLGARIVNFDENTSLGKTLRKPQSDLPHWTRASTVRRLEVLMQGIKGKSWAVTGKLNRNCVILKVL